MFHWLILKPVMGFHINGRMCNIMCGEVGSQRTFLLQCTMRALSTAGQSCSRSRLRPLVRTGWCALLSTEIWAARTRMYVLKGNLIFVLP